MPPHADLIKIVFASGSDDLNPWLIDEIAGIYPDLPLFVVSEFPPHRGEWIPYHVHRTLRENLAACRAAVHGRKIRLAAVMLQPNMPYRRMRLIALLMSPVGFIAYNEHLGSFMLRPRNVSTMARHAIWRTKNFFRWQSRPGGHAYTWVWRATHPRAAKIPLLAAAARLAAWSRIPFAAKGGAIAVSSPKADGVSVVIPSRNGKQLLEQMLPTLLRELGKLVSEIVVVDNGSDDGTAAWLQGNHPEIRVEKSPAPLSFAQAVNRGISIARYSHTCLLNNDMLVLPGFFPPLLEAFRTIPHLFGATAQIFFPPGIRREETGKAVMRQVRRDDFPVRCDEPILGENLSYVLYGSGGCTLFATEKLRALGGLNEIYKPAYVEDLDLGYRAWLRGWPTVFVAQAQVEHRHRATTSKYYSRQQLETFVEINYLKFLAQAVTSPRIFRRLWKQAIDRLQILGVADSKSADVALAEAWRIPSRYRRSSAATVNEEQILALTSGDVAIFPGRPKCKPHSILVATPYLPFPLSHGGAVRMFNLVSRAAADYDQILVAFTDELAASPEELLAVCAEIILVRRKGTHFRRSARRPDVVEEFDAPAFHAALKQAVEKWSPAVVQLEFTQMAQYAGACGPTPTVLVEHDITYDLQQQLLSHREDWEVRRQWRQWKSFETDAWTKVDQVVTMSEKDRLLVGEKALSLPNGVDVDRFRPTDRPPEPGRLLFIGSFAHLPNLLALDFFLHEVWPLLGDLDLKLHVIAGARHDSFLQHYNHPRLSRNIRQPGIEVEGFVSDVRPAYERASLVIAPLIASAGTNIKILEAMAMGKAIVSTRAGIN
ncbi:MAG: glycosyltransferase, partial [Acidobacteriota bacterium]|nr:glycosyltransferase [Acidobacteriota bacterium]